MKLGLPQIVHLVVAGLGVLNLFLAFANINAAPSGSTGSSFYDIGVGTGWIPVLLFIGGVLSLTAILPGEDRKPGLPPVAITVGATLGFLFLVFSLEPSQDMGAGGIMVMIFAIIQALAAIAAYLVDAGIIKLPAPGAQAPYGAQGGYAQPPGQFPQQQPGQPGQYGQPGAQTQYQPQPGQLPQQPGPQYPSTPPGGYPQQG